MIFTEPKSELQVRLHVAEVLKDKIECDNYGELCEKMFIYIINGIVLPKTSKDPLEETILNLSKAMQNNINITDSLPLIPKINEKESQLKELATKNLIKLVKCKEIDCNICGYSLEFDCLIAGNSDPSVKSATLSNTDVILHPFLNYFYVPKEIVKE